MREGDDGYNDDQHQQFWFTEPPGGWNSDPKKVEILPEMDETELAEYWPK